jgi:fermentation-respiration switch protein FrsA (DUF1100 family)
LQTVFRKKLMDTILWLIAAYVIFCVCAYFGNRIFMYYPDPVRISPIEAGLVGVEEIELASGDGETLVAWYAKAKPGQLTTLYFHGNAGNAAGRAGKIETMRTGGAGVLYLNNRSYGGSSGQPTEKANVADAVTAYEHLLAQNVKPQEIVLYGESLGTGQATQLGAQREVKAVVLEAPLTSTVDVGKSTWFFLPLNLLMTDQYRNARHVANVHVPLLVLHGDHDGTIPVQMGKRVFEAANEPKKLELFPNGGHSDLFDQGAWEKVQAFLKNIPAR